LQKYHASSHRLSGGRGISTLAVPASESSRAGISSNSLADSSYVSVPSNSLIVVSTESISCQLICLAFWHKNNGIIEQCSCTCLDVPLIKVTCHHSPCGSVRFRGFGCQFYITGGSFPCNDTKAGRRTLQFPFFVFSCCFGTVILALSLLLGLGSCYGYVIVASAVKRMRYPKRGLKKLARLRFLASLFRP